VTHTLGHLFADLPDASTQEQFQTLAAAAGARVERIVSCGQTTPPDEWYDQDHDEWVVVLQGSARLVIEGQPGEISLGEGDWVDLPTRCRHRVSFTSSEPPCVWLAIHLPAAH
jgi:cupin 2 domain-containing protein